MRLKKLIKDPFFHFLFLGLLIFLINGFINGTEQIENSKIVIDTQIEKSINDRFVSQWKRSPTQEEFDYLVEDYIKKEVLYREAIALNLDKNDEIIKRRLSQKMEALMNDFNSISNDIGKELINDYYLKNKEKYSTPKRYSFYQIGFNQKNESNAIKVLEKYKEEKDIQQLKELGEIDIFPFFFADVTKENLVSQFGGELPVKIENITINTLSGPYKSGFGEHLIYIIKIEESKPIPLENVREKVIADLKYESEIGNQNKFYQELAKKYQILKTFKYSEK